MKESDKRADPETDDKRMQFLERENSYIFSIELMYFEKVQARNAHLYHVSFLIAAARFEQSRRTPRSSRAERRLSIFDARMQLEGHAIEASAASASLGAA